MHRIALISVVGAVAAGLVFGVAALAGATGGSDESPSTPLDVSSPAASAAPTDENGAVAPTDIASAPATGAPEDDSLEEPDDEEAVDERTTALNPAGHCVAVPNSSDVIREPDKHPGWTIQQCEPSGDSADDSQEPPEAEGDDEDGGLPDVDEPEDEDGGAEARTAALNPEGVCIQMPNSSDIIQHPEKHPEWTVGGC